MASHLFSPWCFSWIPALEQWSKIALAGSTLHQLHLLWPSCLNAQLSSQMLVLAVARFRGDQQLDNLGGFQQQTIGLNISQCHGIGGYYGWFWVIRTSDFHGLRRGWDSNDQSGIPGGFALEVVVHPPLCSSQGSFSATECRTKKLCWQRLLCIPMWHMWRAPHKFLWTKFRKKQLRWQWGSFFMIILINSLLFSGYRQGGNIWI